MSALFLIVIALLAWPSSPRAERPFGAPRRQNSTAGPMEVAYVMDLLALALSGGAPAVVSLEAVAASCARPLAAPLERVAAAMRWGVEDDRAWATVEQAWMPVASAFALASRAGAAPSGLLRRAAADLRARETERVTVAGAKAGVRVVLPLGLCFLPAFILLTIVPLVLGLVHPLG